MIHSRTLRNVFAAKSKQNARIGTQVVRNILSFASYLFIIKMNETRRDDWWRDDNTLHVAKITCATKFTFSNFIHYLLPSNESAICDVHSDLTARLSWINWENLGVHPGRRTLLTSLALTGDPNINHTPSHNKYGLWIYCQLGTIGFRIDIHDWLNSRLPVALKAFIHWCAKYIRNFSCVI